MTSRGRVGASGAESLGHVVAGRRRRGAPDATHQHRSGESESPDVEQATRGSEGVRVANNERT